MFYVFNSLFCGVEKLTPQFKIPPFHEKSGTLYHPTIDVIYNLNL